MPTSTSVLALFFNKYSSYFFIRLTKSRLPAYVYAHNPVQAGSLSIRRRLFSNGAPSIRPAVTSALDRSLFQYCSSVRQAVQNRLAQRRHSLHSLLRGFVKFILRIFICRTYIYYQPVKRINVEINSFSTFL